VPCAVAPFHCNYLVNPQHPDFAELTINGPADFDVDPRLAA
jgi:RES domain-containing protein